MIGKILNSKKGTAKRNQLSCIIIDDDAGALLDMAKLVARTPELSLRASFPSVEKAKEWLGHNSIDLIFFNIEMQGLSSIDIAILQQEKTHIIFTSAHSEYAVQSYELGAIDYLLKPISALRFSKAVERALSAIPQAESITVRTDRHNIRLNPSEIVYIEGMKDYVKIHCIDRRIISRVTIKALLDILPEADFIRIHKSYIVNLKHVTTFDNSTVEMAPHCSQLSGPILTAILPLGASYRSEFEKRWR